MCKFLEICINIVKFTYIQGNMRKQREICVNTEKYRETCVAGGKGEMAGPGKIRSRAVTMRFFKYIVIGKITKRSFQRDIESLAGIILRARSALSNAARNVVEYE